MLMEVRRPEYILNVHDQMCFESSLDVRLAVQIDNATQLRCPESSAQT